MIEFFVGGEFNKSIFLPNLTNIYCISSFVYIIFLQLQMLTNFYNRTSIMKILVIMNIFGHFHD